MTIEEIDKIASDYLNDCESELDMLEVFVLAKVALEQGPCEDAISRQAAIDAINTAWTIDDLDNLTNAMLTDMIKSLPPVTPQEPSITWVTGADDAKIAFLDVPVWKVKKLCEILGEPQESEDKE